MVTGATDQGIAFSTGPPDIDIKSAGGNIPSALWHEHLAAPVVRTVVTVFDRPSEPMKFESFIDVGDEQKWAEYAALAEQEQLLLLFNDKGLAHRLTKCVTNGAGQVMNRILNWADRVAAAIPEEDYDFDAAKAHVMATTRL